MYSLPYFDRDGKPAILELSGTKATYWIHWTNRSHELFDTDRHLLAAVYPTVSVDDGLTRWEALIFAAPTRKLVWGHIYPNEPAALRELHHQLAARNA